MRQMSSPFLMPIAAMMATMALLLSIALAAPQRAYAAAFSGTVTAEVGGAPVVGARVQILQVIGDSVTVVAGPVPTNAAGAYTVNIPDTITGNLFLDVSAPDQGLRTEVENLDVIAGIVQNPALGNVVLGAVNVLPIVTGSVTPAAATSSGQATVVVERQLGAGASIMWQVFDEIAVNVAGAYQIFDSLPADTDAAGLPGAGNFRLSASAPLFVTSVPQMVVVTRPGLGDRIATPNEVNFTLEPAPADTFSAFPWPMFLPAISNSKQ